MLSITGIFICQQKHIEGERMKGLLYPDTPSLKHFGHFAGEAASRGPDHAEGKTFVFHSELMVNFIENGFRRVGDLPPQAFEFLNHLNSLGRQGAEWPPSAPPLWRSSNGFPSRFSIFRNRPHMDRYPIFRVLAAALMDPCSWMVSRMRICPSRENGIPGIALDPELDPQFFMCVPHVRVIIRCPVRCQERI